MFKCTYAWDEARVTRSRVVSAAAAAAASLRHSCSSDKTDIIILGAESKDLYCVSLGEEEDEEDGKEEMEEMEEEEEEEEEKEKDKEDMGEGKNELKEE